jgi:hypothetical protein
MQSNAHTRDRQGKWDVDGLEGAALQIVSSDEQAAKLVQEWVPCILSNAVALVCSLCFSFADPSSTRVENVILLHG